MVDRVVNVIYGVIDVVDDGRIADGVLDGADFVFDFVQTEGGIGEQNGLIFYQADFILDFVEAENTAVDGVIDLIDGVVGLIDGVVNVVDSGIVADGILDGANLVFDFFQAKNIVGEEVIGASSPIFYHTDFILDFVEAENTAVDGVVDLVNGVVGLIDGVVNVVDDGCVADSVFDDADFVFDLI